MSSNPSISGDGRVVVFSGWSGGLVDGDDGAPSDVFVHDLATLTTERVSQTAAGAGGDGYSTDAAVVAFQSEATDLVAAADTNGGFDVFLHDLATGATTRPIRDRGGGQPDRGTGLPVLGTDAGHDRVPGQLGRPRAGADRIVGRRLQRAPRAVARRVRRGRGAG